VQLMSVAFNTPLQSKKIQDDEADTIKSYRNIKLDTRFTSHDIQYLCNGHHEAGMPSEQHSLSVEKSVRAKIGVLFAKSSS